MAKTKNKSVVENSIDNEQVDEVAVPNHADLRFSDKKAELEASQKTDVEVAKVEVNYIPKRMEFNPKNLRR